MSKQEVWLAAAFFFARKEASFGARRPVGRRALCMLAAAVLAGGGGSAGAATVRPEAGLDGMFRLPAGFGSAPGPYETAIVPDPQSPEPGADPDGEAEAMRIAATRGAKTGSMQADGASAPASEPAATPASSEDGLEAPAPSDAAEAAESSPPASGAGRAAAGQDLPFGLRSFGGPSPCHWAHPDFSAAPYRDRCGYPTVVVARSAPAPAVRFSGGIGGGGKAAGAPLPGAGQNPAAPSRPSEPGVTPVPVPAAWMLLASAAAPLLLRRRLR